MKIENLNVSYGNNKVFENFSVEFFPNEITCILGKSGVGKTTLLKFIAGILDKQSSVLVDDKVSFVFQTPELIDNLSIKNNLLLVCRDLNKIQKGLEKVALFDKINKKCGGLSLGEKQRVNLLRAFLYDAKVTLLDEPFSSLDLFTKRIALDYFYSLYGNSKTAIMVTHDIDEAVAVADRIIVLGKNKVLKEIRLEKSNSIRGFSENPELNRELYKILSRE